MNELDMDSLLGAEDDGDRSRRDSRSSAGKGRRRRRRRRPNRGRFLAPMLALVVLVGVIGGGGYYGYTWLRDAMVPDDFTGQGSGEVIIKIQSGQSASEVAQTLEDQGVVASARAFTGAIDAAGKSSELQPGEYKLRKGMAAKHAVELLDPKLRLLARVTLPEGLRLRQVLERLAAETGKPVEEFQQAAKDAKALGLPRGARGNLEGYAFPATYEISPSMTATDILAAMVERYDQAADKLSLVAAARRLGHTPHEVMTIASIVQAESGKVDDMGKIARVIYNRLDHRPPMQLRMDSTVMYGLNKFGIAATNADLESKSPYNTYKRLGLPPGPIANPGEHAIEAALNPAKGDWLFFVTTDPKNNVTKFTAKESEFYQFKAEFERNRRGGG
jgi:UPF0755 protein